MAHLRFENVAQNLPVQSPDAQATAKTRSSGAVNSYAYANQLQLAKALLQLIRREAAAEGLIIEVGSRSKIHALADFPDANYVLRRGRVVYPISNEGYDNVLLEEIVKRSSNAMRYVGIMGGLTNNLEIIKKINKSRSAEMEIDLVDANAEQIAYQLISISKYNCNGRFPVHKLGNSGLFRKYERVTATELSIHNMGIAHFLNKKIRHRANLFVYLSNVPEVSAKLRNGSFITISSYSQSPEQPEEIFSAFMNNNNIEYGSTMFATGPMVLPDAVFFVKTSNGIRLDAAYSKGKLFCKKDIELVTYNAVWR
ncbi:MAG: hypothetical protein QXT43_02800 [Candidatus Micrarchaeaceae archaeon]